MLSVVALAGLPGPAGPRYAQAPTWPFQCPLTGRQASRRPAERASPLERLAPCRTESGAQDTSPLLPEPRHSRLTYIVYREPLFTIPGKANCSLKKTVTGACL